MADKKTKTLNRKGIKFQIQSKISSSIMLVMTLVLILVVAVVYNLLTDANNTEVQLDSEAVSLQVEKYFAPFETMAEQLALDADVKKLLTTTKSSDRMNENSMYKTVLEKMIAVKGLDNENIQGVFIADLDSSASITSAGSISDPDYDVTTRAWYECVTSKKTIMTNIYVSASTGKKILSAATPVYDDNGVIVGAAGIDIVIETISDFMKDYTIGEAGYVSLMANDGTFVYHPKDEYIDTKMQDIPNVSDNIVKAIESKSAQLVKYKINSETKYGYIMPIGDTGFIALSSIPSGQYYSELVTAVAILAILLVAGLAFIIFIISRLAGNIVKPLLELNANAMELAAGNLDVTIKADTEDEVGDLGRSIDKTVKRLKEYIDYIDEISEVLADMADGKLSINLKYAYVGEFEKVKNALLHISDAMNDVMTNIAQSAGHVSMGSEDLARAAQGMAESCENQAAAVEELLATATTVAEQVKENKGDSEKSAAYTKEVADMMETSKQQMAVMREAMDKIQESSNKVVGVIKTIEDIAEQTNLLSLNASIEAARAGEVGKGFAVVAGEIGGLANQSASAVNTTRDLISVSLSEIERGNELVNEVVASLNSAVERTVIANEMIQKSAETAEVQMHSVNQIRDGVSEMSQTIQDNSAMAEETSATSEELAAQAVTLNQLVQKFELK